MEQLRKIRVPKRIQNKEKLLYEDSSQRECEKFGKTGKKELCDEDMLPGDATLYKNTCSGFEDFQTR